MFSAHVRPVLHRLKFTEQKKTQRPAFLIEWKAKIEGNEYVATPRDRPKKVEAVPYGVPKEKNQILENDLRTIFLGCNVMPEVRKSKNIFLKTIFKYSFHSKKLFK